MDIDLIVVGAIVLVDIDLIVLDVNVLVDIDLIVLFFRYQMTGIQC